MSAEISRGIAKNLLESGKASSPRDLVNDFIAAIPSGLQDEVLRELAEEFLVQQAYYFRTDSRQKFKNEMKQNTWNNKATQASDAWKNLMASLVFDPVQKKWIQLGDATAKNLRNIAEGQRELAAKHTKIATEYDRLAHELETRKKTKVSQLPQKVVKAALA